MTKRLVIKPYSDTDQTRLIELLTDERVKATFMIPDFSTHAEAVAMSERLIHRSHCDEHYERGIYADRMLIGFVNDVDMDNTRIEIGYVIHPDHWNQGYATEAISAVIRDLFRKGYIEIKAASFADNAASRRVMEKYGMRRNGETSVIAYHGVLWECIYYAIKCDIAC